MSTNPITLSGLHVYRKNRTMYVVLPKELWRPVTGSCHCRFCMAHPDLPPCFDTLGINEPGPEELGKPGRAFTWMCHFPELHHPEEKGFKEAIS